MKNYFSGGRYFNAEKLSLPPHSSVVQVNGYCNMFEIPVNLLLRVVNKQRTFAFVSAGVSSYFMQEEEYDYIYKRYNEACAGRSEYRRHSSNWTSIANAGIGIEQMIQNKLALRVETYLRIPINGFGIGALPISSKGLLFGLVRSF